jgi:putative ABC transport system substrate-binding protein
MSLPASTSCARPWLPRRRWASTFNPSKRPAPLDQAFQNALAGGAGAFFTFAHAFAFANRVRISELAVKYRLRQRHWCDFLSNKLVAKRSELLAKLVSAAAPIGMLAHTNNPNTGADVRDALAAASVLGRTLHVERVASPSELDAAITALVQQRVGALFVAPQADFRSWQRQILTLAERNALPTSFSNSDFVIAGGLMSYGPNQIESYREAGIYTGRILKGEKPSELPVLVSTKFTFAINIKSAKALGLTIPPSMLALTTMLIE